MIRFFYTVILIVSLGVSSIAHSDDSDRFILDGLISEFGQSRLVKDTQVLKADVEKQVTVYLDFEVAINSLITGDFIEVTLIGDGYFLSIDKTQIGSPGVITYIGSIYNQDYEKVPGSVLLTRGNDLVHGLISTPTGIFQILPGGEEAYPTYLLQKMKQHVARGFTDFPETPVDDNMLSQFESLPFSDIDPPMAMAMSGATVDVLVLFTPGARSNQGGASATVNWVNTIIADFNQKLVEVGLNSYSLSLKAALETKWPTFSTPYHENSTYNGPNACLIPPSTYCDSLVADQHWLATNSTVASLRNQYSADLVVLITADNQKHPSDFAHGFAGLKGGGSPGVILHGGTCGTGSRTCGEFVSVRDIYALSNLTFHHEVGHALRMKHNDGLISFGFFSNSSEQTTYKSHLKPMTIMAAAGPICTWSTAGSRASCHMRLPFFADNAQYRTMFYTFLVPRKFGPLNHVEDDIDTGMTWLSTRR